VTAMSRHEAISPFGKGSLKTGSLHTTIRQLYAAAPDLYLFKRQKSFNSVQQTQKIQKNMSL